MGTTTTTTNDVAYGFISAGGNPNNPNTFPQMCFPIETNLSFRCCSNDQVKIPMSTYLCTGDCGNCKSKNYEEAARWCDDHGLRLCTLQETWGSGTSCWMHFNNLFASH